MTHSRLVKGELREAHILTTIHLPSSYTIQILWPSAFHFMSRTTLLFLLLIISSYHDPEYCKFHKNYKSIFLFHLPLFQFETQLV